MLLKEFPDIAWLKSEIATNFQRKRSWTGTQLSHSGWPTAIINTSVKNAVRNDIKGTLSIFSNLSGESLVTVERRTIRLLPGQYFVTNQDQVYTLEIDGQQPTETFNIHLGTNFIQTVLADSQKKAKDLLEPSAGHMPVNFHNALLFQDPTITNIFHHLKRSGEDQNSNTLWHDEVLHDLMSHLLSKEQGLRQSILELPSLKKATRDELGKRLYIVADFIQTHYAQNLELEDLSRLACLSKFHFLRLFKSVFKQSPHQYLMAIRVQRAQDMLRHTSKSSWQIALETGLNNASSLTRIFHQKVGCSPSTYRSTFRN